jgi:hypothetical protein
MAPEVADSSAAWTSFSSDHELYAIVGGGGDAIGGGRGALPRTSSAGTTPAPPDRPAYSVLV